MYSASVPSANIAVITSSPLWLRATARGPSARACDHNPARHAIECHRPPCAAPPAGAYQLQPSHARKSTKTTKYRGTRLRGESGAISTGFTQVPHRSHARAALTWVPVRKSQNNSRLSSPQLAKMEPSAAQSNCRTAPECPLSVCVPQQHVNMTPIDDACAPNLPVFVSVGDAPPAGH